MTGNGSQSSLYAIDPNTAAATLIGEVTIGTFKVAVTGLAFHPGTGLLYGVSGSEYEPSRQLMIINPLTAQATSLGTIGTTRFENVSDISFAPDGTLYGWTVRGGPLVQIDPSNAARTVIGSSMNGTGGNGLAFTPDGTLYLVGPTAPGDLYSVNVSTGAITSVATLSGVPLDVSIVNGMASDPSGVLYATTRSTADLLRIDRVTGVVTLVGAFSFGEADGIAFIAIPEPATWQALALGLMLLGLLQARARVALC